MAFQTILEDIKNSLQSMAPTISVILIILAGVVYGVAQLQPAEERGKYISTAISMLVGGVVIAAISFAAEEISRTSQGMLI